MIQLPKTFNYYFQMKKMKNLYAIHIQNANYTIYILCYMQN